MYHLGHAGIASVEMLQELHPEGHASATVILVEEKGMGNTAGVGHPAEGLKQIAHLVRMALCWAM